MNQPSTETKNTCDIVVIGGGPAGYTAAIQAARMGASTVLIEKNTLGGTCLNRGCIPTKTYLKNVEILDYIRKAPERGIEFPARGDFSPLLNREKNLSLKNKVVQKLVSGVKHLVSANKIKLIQGSASPESPGVVTVQGENSRERITGKQIILCGGSLPAVPPIPGIDHPKVVTSDELLELPEIPKRLVIIGGGVIGVELSLIYNAFGSRVTICELDQKILPLLDRDLSAITQKMLLSRNIQITCGNAITEIKEDSSGSLQVRVGDKTLPCDMVLSAVGRKADFSSLGSLSFSKERGCLSANDYLQTDIPGIYAAGDITGKKMLAHSAYRMGEIAAKNAVASLRNKPLKKLCLKYIPQTVYGPLESGSIGLTEAEARKLYPGGINIGKFPLSANGLALSAGKTEGFLKVISDKKHREILGVHMAGMSASEIINEASALMTMEITAEEIIDIVHGHPTVGEAFTEAAADTLGEAFHLPPKL